MNSSRNIGVVIADDNPVFRRTFLEILTRKDAGIRVIAEAVNGEELLEIARQSPADVYVVDIEMPVLNGIEAVERLLRERPGSRVVILSMYRDRALVERAYCAGARGYVLKENAAADIVPAIVEVHGGRNWSSPAVR
jgi:DNA-binding NarL/FixJ family response regulator